MGVRVRVRVRVRVGSEGWGFGPGGERLPCVVLRRDKVGGAVGGSRGREEAAGALPRGGVGAGGWMVRVAGVLLVVLHLVGLSRRVSEWGKRVSECGSE